MFLDEANTYCGTDRMTVIDTELQREHLDNDLHIQIDWQPSTLCLLVLPNESQEFFQRHTFCWDSHFVSSWMSDRLHCNASCCQIEPIPSHLLFLQRRSYIWNPHTQLSSSASYWAGGVQFRNEGNEDITVTRILTPLGNLGYGLDRLWPGMKSNEPHEPIDVTLSS